MTMKNKNKLVYESFSDFMQSNAVNEIGPNTVATAVTGSWEGDNNSIKSMTRNADSIAVRAFDSYTKEFIGREFIIKNRKKSDLFMKCKISRIINPTEDGGVTLGSNKVNLFATILQISKPTYNMSMSSGQNQEDRNDPLYNHKEGEEIDIEIDFANLKINFGHLNNMGTNDWFIEDKQLLTALHKKWQALSKSISDTHQKRVDKKAEEEMNAHIDGKISSVNKLCDFLYKLLGYVPRGMQDMKGNEVKSTKMTKALAGLKKLKEAGYEIEEIENKKGGDDAYEIRKDRDMVGIAYPDAQGIYNLVTTAIDIINLFKK